MPGSIPRQTSPLVVVGNGLVHLVGKFEVRVDVLNVVVAVEQIEELEHLAGFLHVADRHGRLGDEDVFGVGDFIALLFKRFANVHHG